MEEKKSDSFFADYVVVTIVEIISPTKASRSLIVTWQIEEWLQVKWTKLWIKRARDHDYVKYSINHFVSRNFC